MAAIASTATTLDGAWSKRMKTMSWPQLGKEDAKRLEKAARIAEQKAAKKKKASTRHGRMPLNKIVGQHLGLLASPKQPLGPGGVPVMTGPAPLRTNRQRPQPLGPCWRCHQMSHLQASCTQPERPYPLILQTPLRVDRFLGHSIGSSHKNSYT